MHTPTTVNISDVHVCYVYAHAGVMHETAIQLGITLEGKLLPCWGCSMAKGKRKYVARTTCSRAERPLQRVFIDLSGPKPVKPVGGSQYIMQGKEDFSRYGWTYFLKSKSEASAFRRCLADVRASGVPFTVECIRTDNRGEFTGGAFKHLCDERGIPQEFTTADMPKLNRLWTGH